MLCKEHILWDRIIVNVTFIYGLGMVTLFLFYSEDGFFHITDAKFHYFVLLSLVFIALSLCCLCIRFLRYHEFIHLRHLIHTLSITDWCMLLLLASHTITQWISPFPAESFGGINGRHMGYGFTLLITAVYFLVSRNIIHRKLLIHSFLIAAAIVNLLGIVNAFGFDPLHFFDRLSLDDQSRFLSTVGNVTFFAQLLCLSTPIAAMLFGFSQKSKQRYGYAAFIFLGFFGLLLAHIDGAYLGLVTFLLYFFERNVNNQKGLRDFLILLSLFFAAVATGQICGWLFSPFPMEGISQFLLASPWIWAALCLSLLGVFYCEHKAVSLEALPYAKIRRYVMIFVILCVITVIGLMFFFTSCHPEWTPSSLCSYLRFDDAWGSQRGRLWRQLSNLYIHDFTFIQKLFGQGLDCTRMILTQALGNAYLPFDNAHNEYLQYLVTGGLCGLTLYLILGGSLLIRLTARKDQPLAPAIAAAMIAYGTQAITSLNQPITTPLLFLLFAIGESLLRQTPMKNQDNPIIAD